VVAIPDRGSTHARRGAAIWELYGPEPTEFLNYVRSVSLVHGSGRWSFDAAGTPQPFESESRYLAERARDRFDLELLTTYLEALGIRAFDEAFYAASGWLVETFREAMRRGSEVTLAEARVSLGLD
jgi:hypothetical protein